VIKVIVITGIEATAPTRDEIAGKAPFVCSIRAGPIRASTIRSGGNAFIHCPLHSEEDGSDCPRRDLDRGLWLIGCS
jgi:hypothetical protein